VKPHAAPPSRQPAAGAVSGDDAIGGGVSGGGHAAPDGAASGGGAAGGKPLSAIEARTSPAGRVWDPNVTRTMPAEVKARRAAEPKPPEKPVPAARLDMPLSFTRAPAGDVYDRLAKAHGVRFEFGPGVDRAVPVTLNLQGRPLGIALEMMMLQTRHRVVRKADGVYMIEGPEAGRAIGVAPVTEETIQGEAP
jgi:hypothetical protein